MYLHVDTYIMARNIIVKEGKTIKLSDNVEEIFERKVTKYGNGAKVDAQKKYIGRRAYVIILKD
jgi:putative transposon-encoded protein